MIGNTLLPDMPNKKYKINFFRLEAKDSRRPSKEEMKTIRNSCYVDRQTSRCISCFLVSLKIIIHLTTVIIKHINEISMALIAQ